MRSHGAALANLLGPRRLTRRPPESYESLAEALADNLPKPLAEELAGALGIEVHADEPQPEAEPEAAPVPEKLEEPDEFAVMFGLVGGKTEAKRHFPPRPVSDDDGRQFPPLAMGEDLAERFTIPSGYVDPETGTRFLSKADWHKERATEVRKSLHERFPNEPLTDEVMVLDNGRIEPSLIARAALYKAMRSGSKEERKAFQRRFAKVFGRGSAMRVLSGQG